MRRGRVYKRCSKCGAGIEERTCPSCGAREFAWAFVVDVAPPGAPRKQRRRGGFKTKAGAIEALEGITGAVRNGSYVEASKVTLRSFLVERWLPAMRGTIRASTWESYRMSVEQRIAPRIGDVPLQALTSDGLGAFYADLLESGRHDGGGGLSPKTVRNVHVVLRKALGDGPVNRFVKNFTSTPPMGHP